MVGENKETRKFPQTPWLKGGETSDVGGVLCLLPLDQNARKQTVASKAELLVVSSGL